MMNALQSFVLATKKRRIRDEELNNNNNSLLVRNASFVLIVSLLLPGYSKGFMPSHQITTHKTETKASISPLFLRRLVDKSKHFIEDHFGDDEDEGDEKNEWLSWMSTGIRIKKYNYDEVKMREDERLGGLPRSVGYSSRDWLHNTLTLATSAILRDISFPVISMTIWSTCISLIHKYLLTSNRIISAQNMCIPSHPHSLLVSSLGLLLVFRTNSAYQRFVEGRKIWEQILSVSRDLSRMIKLYAEQIGAEKHRRLLKLLAAFPYLLRHRIRPNLLYRKLLDPTYKRDPEHSLLLYDDLANYDDDAEAAGVANEEESTGMSRRKTRELYWVDKRTLPWRLLPKGAMEGCAKAQNRPLFICDRMAKEFTTVANSDTFSARERLSFLSKIDKLSECIGQCERIHQTVVPLNYARHALRSLSIWLLALPFALIKDLGLLTGPVVGVMSWLLFGVYEIGYTIEDPFQGTLRLSILCDGIRRDVLGDDLHRDTAFQLNEPDKTKIVVTNINKELFVLELEDDFEENEEADEDTTTTLGVLNVSVDDVSLLGSSSSTTTTLGGVITEINGEHSAFE